MSLLSAYVGVSGLADMGYRFYNVDETVNGARITTGIVDGGNGWYSVNATIPGGATSVRWDSTGTPTAIAREYFYDYSDSPGVTTLLTRLPSALTVTSGKIDVNDKTGFALISAYDPAKTAMQAGASVTVGTNNDKAGYSLVAAYDPAKTAAQVGNAMTLTAAYDAAKLAAPVGAAMTLTSVYDAAKTASTQASVNTISGYVDTEVGAIKTVTDKLDTTLELDGAVYRYTTNALEQAPTSGGGGQYAQSEYRSDTATTAASDPGTGDVRWNNATQSLASALYFDDITSNGGDASNVFASIVPGDILTLQQKNSAANVQRWIITSALDNTGWWTLNITPSLFEGTNIGNNEDVIVRIAHPATTLEQIADAILKRDWTALSGEAAYSLLNAVRMLRCKWDTAGGTLTVRKEDGSSVAWTRTLSTDPTAQPITGVS